MKVQLSFGCLSRFYNGRGCQSNQHDGQPLVKRIHKSLGDLKGYVWLAMVFKEGGGERTYGGIAALVSGQWWTHQDETEVARSSSGHRIPCSSTAPIPHNGKCKLILFHPHNQPVVGWTDETMAALDG